MKSIEQTYTKKTQLEHILLRPDTYIGSVERYQQQMWVLDAGKLAFRNTTYVPGLYKIFDEILVNAADNKQRDRTMNKLQVHICPNNGISVWNNGKGIPIAIHQEHNVYVPELIFGHLLTGSNFDDTEDKTTGGRNGYGAKLANIFSTEFIIETADSERGLQYKQIFRNNMSVIEPPQISKYSGGSDYTCVTFKPDLKRFKMNVLEPDTIALFGKRVYDIAGCNKNGTLAVFLNGEKLGVKSFRDYINCYTESPEQEELIAFETINDRWEVGVAISDGSFHQVSFVNSICTTKGGTHVMHVVDQITNRLVNTVKKKNKGTEVKPANIRNHLFVYVNSLITNPAFDSQCKETLTTRPNAFGGSKAETTASATCTISEKMLKQIENSNIIDHILRWAKTKQDQELKKKGGTKLTKVLGITKLDDANYAGTAKGRDCTLILTEGDSAKALAISGLSVIGRDYYGVFPLKGKLLNVREANHAQIMKNEEIQNIAKILGLTFGKSYDDCSSMRYGHLMIMTDQDHDGSHIKGLIINFIHHFWPSLLKIKGFLQQFITPIVKCSKGRSEEVFFTIPEYENWRRANEEGKGWKIKYYKGLGTSTAAEAKDYFANLDKHLIDFAWDEQLAAVQEDAIELAFSKKRADDRKQWLLDMEANCFIDYDVESISYSTFVNKELILFSHADNARSIPHIMDGFKPSQRKVLYCCFKRNLKSEVKVAQLAGYVAEHSAYHHGEMSLTQTIIGMAQNFVGSNNVNLLSPCGQFGTRLMGGKDAASARYVFTKLEQITRVIFHPDDDPLLQYLDEDGQIIEPEFYAPIIPMLLVNGSEGIGTGWSTSVPTYNPRDIISNLKKMIVGEPQVEMTPWFRGFVGDIASKGGKESGKTFIVSGCAEMVDEQTVIINELPVGKWTSDYKQMLETMVIGNTPPPATTDGAHIPAVPTIKDFKENHTDRTVSFTVHLPQEKLQEIVAEAGGFHKKFKLDSNVSTTNMHAFDLKGRIKKYECVKDIMNQFFDVRMDLYEKRKVYLINKLNEEYEKLDNKVRFILAVIKGTIIVANRKKSEILSDLQKQGFKAICEKKEAEEGDEVAQSTLEKGYDYLLSMKIWSLTSERVQYLSAERDQKKTELDILQRKTPEDLWLADLIVLEKSLDDFDAAIEAEKQEELAAIAKITSKSSKGRARNIAVNAFKEENIILKSNAANVVVRERKEKDPSVSATSKLIEKMSILDGEDAPKSKAPRKKAAPKKEVEMEFDDDIESEVEENFVSSLVANKPARATKKVVYELNDEDSESFDVVEEDEDSDMDDFIVDDSEDEAPKKAKKAPVPKAAPSKAPAAAKPKTKAVKKSSSSDEEESEFEFDGEDFAPKKKAAPKEKTEKKPTALKAREPLTEIIETKTIAKPAVAKAPKKPAAPKKAKMANSDSENDFDDEKPSKPIAAPVARTARNVARKTYADSEPEDEDESDNFSEEEDFDSEDDFSAKKKKKAAPKAKLETKKRPTKKVTSSINDLVFSPDKISPMVDKRARKENYGAAGRNRIRELVDDDEWEFE